MTYSVFRRVFHGTIICTDLAVGTLRIRRWKMNVTTMKKPKNMIWMPSPPRMIFSPLLTSACDLAVVNSPPPGKESVFVHVVTQVQFQLTSTLCKEGKDIAQDKELRKPFWSDYRVFLGLQKYHKTTQNHVNRGRI